MISHLYSFNYLLTLKNIVKSLKDVDVLVVECLVNNNKLV